MVIEGRHIHNIPQVKNRRINVHDMDQQIHQLSNEQLQQSVPFMLILNLRKFQSRVLSSSYWGRGHCFIDRQLNQIVSPRNIKLTVMELG